MSTEAPEQIAPEAVEDQNLEGIHLDPSEAPTKALVLRSRNGKGILEIDPDQKEWTPTQIVGLRSIGIETAGPDGVPDAYVWQFLHMVVKMDLDPWMREAYLITHGKRWTDRNGKVVDNRKFTLVTGIDGFRKKAEDTGQYAGQRGPQWCGEDGVWKDFWNPAWGKPVAARVGILRRGFNEPVWGVAMYDEFVPMVDEYTEKKVTKNGQYGPYEATERVKTGEKAPTPMWEKMGANQIAKCAEAQGFRKAFPRTMAGMYEAAEMQRAQAEYEQQQRDEHDRQLRAKRAEAITAHATKPAAAAPAEPMKAAEPVKVGEAAAEVAASIKVEKAAPSEPAAEAETPEGALVLARKELMFQADVIGDPNADPADRLAKHVKRKVEAHDKPLGHFTAAELLTIAVPMRKPVIAALYKAGEREKADHYAEVGDHQYVDPDVLGVVEGEIDHEDVDPTKPHDYIDAGGICVVCDEEQDHVLHPEA